MFGSLGATLSDEVGILDDALTFARIAAQHAPAGHAIFDAIKATERDETYVKGLIPWYSTGSDDAPADVVALVEASRNKIFDAAADIRNDPDAPLAPTIWETIKSWPWPALAGGAAALAAILVYYRKRRRR